jgi:hypothetical protein
VAREIGADPAFVIAATHGKRAIDNLARFKPHLLSHEMNAAVEEFERSILFYADACAQRSPAPSSTPLLSDSDSDSDSGPGSCSTAGCSFVPSAVPGASTPTEQLVAVSGELADGLAIALSVVRGDGSNEWELELEAVEVDRAVRILPGVKALLESIPEGRYAVATSGAKTYGALRF